MALSEHLENVSKTIICIHREAFDESPSPMKLQKLCYYAQGYSLAEGEELFPENFQAWQHGPVIPELYHQYKHFQWRQINDDFDLPEYDSISFLQDIVSAYGRYDGAALSTMTHREQPWIDARGDLGELEGCTEIISKDSLRSYFSSKLKMYA
ncbi:MAG: type II toxin-antitoxin system antitoxin SocA domain-containing protein [Cyanobacteria bacterium P01_F01_bin.150]